MSFYVTSGAFLPILFCFSLRYISTSHSYSCIWKTHNEILKNNGIWFDLHSLDVSSLRKLRALSIRGKILIWIFGNFQWRVEKRFSIFPEKRTTLRGTPEIFRNYQPRTSVPFGFLPRILLNVRLNNSLFRNSTILGFTLETFSWNFRTKFPQYRNSWRFWLNVRCPHIKWMNSACIFMYNAALLSIYAAKLKTTLLKTRALRAANDS